MEEHMKLISHREFRPRTFLLFGMVVLVVNLNVLILAIQETE